MGTTKPKSKTISNDNLNLKILFWVETSVITEENL